MATLGVMRSGELGFWWHSIDGPPTPRPPLTESCEVDVAIVGAGYTGLWSAYYLKQADPSLRIAILERDFAGFGASGRNGGWISGFFSGPPRVYERNGGASSYAALQRAMFETVGEICRVAEEEGIDAGIVKGGHISVALNDAQLAHQRAQLSQARNHGILEQDLRALSTGELSERLRIAGGRGGTFSPHVARAHPAKLVVGLAQAVERLGVSIHESTPVGEIRPHEAVTPLGVVRARWIVRATEGYTADLKGLKRALVPMNSSMIVTEPLAPNVWQEIGWQGMEVLGDGAHAYVYLQRTSDGRIAIGGRGVPYRFGSRTDGRGETAARTVESLRRKLTSMFPMTVGVAIDHAWSGVLGVPRDWCVSIEADTHSGLAWAGGYVGEGVAAANLAGRTLRDLILGRATPLTALPWVGRHPPRWEPEPLRWSAIHAVYALYRRADRHEARTGRPSRLGRLVDAATGRE
jgi:glycine/D-amino acid oxidase-like deaminating enzyme